jgi:hypothetical protein
LDNPVRLVRMEMHLTTTSDWTNLTISQGYMADTRLISQSGDGTWTLQTAGLSLGGGDTTGGTKTYTVDMLYTDTDETQPFDFNLTKGLDGTSTVTFTNLDTGAVVAQLSDTDKTTTTQTHPVSTEVTRAAFMGTSHSVLPRVDTRKLVLSFYYPWYTTYQDAGLAEQPSDPRSTYDQAGVTSMTAQAKANGVDGFVVSWSGAAIDDTQMGLAVNAADTEGQVITGYIESAMSGGSYGSPSEARELSWITQLLKYSSNSAFLKTSAGVPIVFVYKMDELTAAQWQDLLSQLKTVYGEQVALVGDDPDAAYLPYEYGVHNYGAVDTQANLTAYSFNTSLGLKEHAALYGGTSPLFVGTASPGYDDQALRGNQNPVVPRNGGTRYVQTWDAALAGEPDWMLVTSWNEWFEDTAIEPGTASGDAALGITGTESATWKATS